MALQDREMMAKDCEGMMNLAEKGKRRRAGWKRRSSAALKGWPAELMRSNKVKNAPVDFGRWILAGISASRLIGCFRGTAGPCGLMSA